MRAIYDPVYPGVYVPGGIDLTAVQRAEAAWLWSRRKAVVSGHSAAVLLGANWVDATLNAELIYANRRPPAGITVHSETLLPRRGLGGRWGRRNQPRPNGIRHRPASAHSAAGDTAA